MEWRFAVDSDLERLATWNRQLQEDEGASVMGARECESRLRAWLGGHFTGVVFEKAGPVGYALYRPTDPDSQGAGGLYLRQFFIDRQRRREGLGAEAFDLFVREILSGRRLLLEALTVNPIGQAFWRSRGLSEYSTTFELAAQDC